MSAPRSHSARCRFPAGLRRFRAAAAALAVWAGASAAWAGPITPGNIVLVRLHDGTSPLPTGAAAVFIEEYTTAGDHVQTIALPTTTTGLQRRLTITGTGSSEGQLTQSADGRYLVLSGYDLGVFSAAPGTGPRVLARIDTTTGEVDTSTAVTTLGSGVLRGAASLDGSGFWAATGTTGLHYVPFASGVGSVPIATTPSNLRVPAIFGGQLFISGSSGTLYGVASISGGMATSPGQTVANLPGLPFAPGPQPNDYCFANSSTLYVADERDITAGGGVQKWVQSAGTWSLAYTIQAGPTGGVGPRSVTCGTNGSGQTVLYITTVDAASAGNNTVLAAVDIGPASAFAPLPTPASAGVNRVFRGVRLVRGTGSGPACTAPAISANPVNAVRCLGSTATFSVTATGTGLGYIWQQSTDGGTTWTGALGNNTSTATMTTTLSAADQTMFRCIVTGACGSAVSNAATMRVGGITPTGATATPLSIMAGQSAVLSATAVGAGDTIEWFAGSCGGGGSPVPGGASPTVSPAVTTTYYARARDTASGCTGPSCASVTVVVNTYSPVVISQIYHRASATMPTSAFNRNYIELHNRSNAAVSLDSYSLQIAPTGTSTGWVKHDLTGTIPAHGYYLVALSTDPGSSGAAIPAPDAAFSPAVMVSATDGKAALVSNQALLPASTCFAPGANGIVDLVGWGAAAMCWEGAGRAPANGVNTSATLRLGAGAQDTDNNSADFVVGAALPRNTLSPAGAALALGACCASDSSCQVLTASQCSAAGGQYAGDGTVCPAPTYSVTVRNATIDDITTQSPTVLPIVGDDEIAVASLPFPFTFFGQVRTDFVACSNGWMSLSPTTSTAFANAAFPGLSTPNDLIAPLWDDLNAGAGSQICTLVKGAAPYRRFIVQWNRMPATSGSGTGHNTFQVILYESSNAIEFRYGTIVPNGTMYPGGSAVASFSAGLENAQGTVGVDIAPASLANGGPLRARLFIPMSSGCPAATGACCTNMVCSVVTMAACQVGGGVYQGHGSPCTPNPCVPPGACCAADGSCTFGNIDNCTAAGGYFKGPGVVCTPERCPMGACCLPSGACFNTVQEHCAAQGGFRWTLAGSCSPNPCVGRCCAADGACTVTTPVACADAGGRYGGDGTACSENAAFGQIAGLPLAIPDNDPAGVSSTITVPSNFTVSRTTVSLSIPNHAAIGDLVITLTHAGRTVVLWDRACPTANNLTATFDDLGAIYGCSPDGPQGTIRPLAGSGGPAGALSDFVGQSASGAWTLHISDHAPLKTGSLVSWSIAIEGNAAPCRGACCSAGGCVQLSSADCTAIAGAVYQGDGTACAAQPTPAAPAAIEADAVLYCANAAPGTITLTAQPPVGGWTGTVTWYAGACSGAPLGTGPALTIPAPSATTTYMARCETPCAYSSCASIQITVLPTAAAPTSAAADVAAFCSGDAPATITLTASGGSGTSLQWFRAGCGDAGVAVGMGSPLTIPAPAATTTYFARWMNTCGPTACVSTTVTVNASPEAPASVGSDVTRICTAAAPETITLAAIGGSGQTLRWYAGACGGAPIGTGTPLTVPAPSTTTTYFARWGTDSCGDSACASVTVEVNESAQPPVSASSDTVRYCSAEAPQTITLTATGGGGGVGEELTWFDDSCGGHAIGQGAVLVIPAPANTTTYHARWSNTNCGPTSCASVTVTVDRSPAPPAVVSADVASFCTADAPATITLSASGGGTGGSTPPPAGDVLEWFADDCTGEPIGTGSPLVVPAPASTRTYLARWRTERCGVSACAPVIITVNRSAEPPASVNASENGYCENDPPTGLTLTAIGGFGDTIEWFAGADCGPGAGAIGTGASLAIAPPTATTTYRARWTNGCGASACTSITVSVIPTPVAPTSAGADAAEYCSDDAPATITLSAAGGGAGSTGTLEWFAGACSGEPIGTGTTLVLPAPAATTIYHARWTNSCAASACVSTTVTVHASPVAPSAAAADTTSFCTGAPPASITLSATAGSGDLLEWFDDSCGGRLVGTGTPLTIPPPAATTTYRARWTTTECGSSACAAVTVNVHESPEAPGSVSADVTGYCADVSPDEIVLSATGGRGGTLQWFADSCGAGEPIGTGSPLVLPAPAATTTYFARWTTDECGSSTCRGVTISVHTPPQTPATASATPARLCDTGSVTLAATAGPGETIDWYAGACSGTPVGSGASLDVTASATTTYFARARNLTTGCVSAACASTTVTVLASPVAPTSATATETSLCQGAVETITLTAAGGSGDTLAWYRGGCGGAGAVLLGSGASLIVPAPSETTTFLARWETAECGVSACASVTVSVQAPPTASAGGGSGGYVVCSDGVAALAGGANHASRVEWMTSGSGVFTDATSPATIYIPSAADAAAGSVTLTLKAFAAAPCTGSVTSSATLSILAKATAPTSATADATEFCPGSRPTITLSAAGGSGTKLAWYSGSCGSALIGTGASIIVPAPAATTTYYAAWVAACGRSECVPVTVTVKPVPVAPSSIVASQTSWCDQSAPSTITLSATGGSGARFEWFAGGCGSGSSIGQGAELTIPAPSATTTYFGRWSNDCGDSACASVTLTVSASPRPPTSAAASRTIVCADDAGTISLTASGGGAGAGSGTLRWYAGGCGVGSAIGTGSPLAIAVPAATTTYFARWESETCGSSACASVTVTVDPLPEAPASATASHMQVCTGAVSTITLTAIGGGGQVLEWWSGACGDAGIFAGVGTSLELPAPTATTSYFARWVNGCGESACASVTVTVAASVGACCTGHGSQKTCTLVERALCNGGSSSPTPTAAYRGDCSTCSPGTCCPGDYDNSGAVTIQDIFAYLADYFQAPPPASADFNNSGATTTQDLFDLLTAYFAGC